MAVSFKGPGLVDRANQTKIICYYLRIAAATWKVALIIFAQGESKNFLLRLRDTYNFKKI